MPRVPVTPERARRWLARNAHDNRPLYPPAVDRYTAEIRSGQWTRWAHRPIEFRGRWLVNGQHRLTAIVASGMTIHLEVREWAHNERTTA